MKKWFPSLLCIVAGAVLGFAAAYALGSLKAIFTSPWLTSKSEKGDDFHQVFDSLAYLGTTEQGAANCSGNSDVQISLTNEAKVIAILAERTKNPSPITSPMDAAQARLAARALIEAEKRSGSEASPELLERATRFATTARWKNPSATHLREIIVALNKDHCEQLPIVSEAR
jgi:hypothetical protein